MQKKLFRSPLEVQFDIVRSFLSSGRNKFKEFFKVSFLLDKDDDDDEEDLSFNSLILVSILTRSKLSLYKMRNKKLR